MFGIMVYELENIERRMENYQYCEGNIENENMCFKILR